MALSMFARTPVQMSSVFRQQLMRLATQPALAQRAQRTVASTLPVSNILIKKGTTTPLINAVASFRTTAPRLSESGHNHAKLWIIERYTAAVLVPLLPLALMFPSKFLDTALALLVTAHSFWGLEAIAVDYVRASIFGPVIPKIAIGLVYAISIATLGGLFYVISHDIGIANTFRNLWAIKPKQNA